MSYHENSKSDEHANWQQTKSCLKMIFLISEYNEVSLQKIWREFNTEARVEHLAYGETELFFDKKKSEFIKII